MGVASSTINGRNLEATSTSECGVVTRWLMMNTTVGTDAHYIRLAYRPEAAHATLEDGTSMGLTQFEAYLSDLRKDMGNNVYDVSDIVLLLPFFF